MSDLVTKDAGGAGAPRRSPRWRLRRDVLLGAVVLAAVGCTAVTLPARKAMGGAVSGDRLARVARSPQWRDGKFHNRLPAVQGSRRQILRESLFGGSEHQTPNVPVDVVPRRGSDFARPPANGLRVTWLGHSTTLIEIEIDGHRVITDPMWSERASPVQFAGPRRFFAPPLPLAELPPVDAVVISHDHYDHLDMATVKVLSGRGVRFLVPLGIGAHLAAWGVPQALVTELDWWDAARVGSLTISATPSRHFSGRGLADRDRTLWAGWAIAGPAHIVFYSGDTALHDELVTIGERLGPFDLTMIEIGEYNALWPDVHLGPEQAVLAHRLVRGRVVLPVHWGRFDMAMHGWTEPIERVLVAAELQSVRVTTPRPGETIDLAASLPVARWWPRVPWKSVTEAPVWSSSVGHLLQRLRERASVTVSGRCT